MLKFFFGNSKLVLEQVIFDLVAGWSCPFAKLCKAYADPKTGKITDGPDTEFRCYAASCETRPNVRNAHWHNFNLIKEAKTKAKILRLILESLPYGLVYRLHSSGDFFSQAYFDAWLEVARRFPERIFYAYTEALPYWVKRLNEIPPNFKLNASYGGAHDYLIEKHGLKSVRVVLSYSEAVDLGLEVDTDDSHAWQQDKSFALMIHGTQPAGSKASQAWYKFKRSTGYGQ